MAVTFTSESSVAVPSHSKTRRRFRFKQLWSLQASSIIRRAALPSSSLILWQICALLKLTLLLTFSSFLLRLRSSQPLWLLCRHPLWIHFQSSISRVIGGFFAGSVLGILIGLLIGSSHLLEEIIATPLELLRPYPGGCVDPMAILMFPDAEIGMFYITLLGPSTRFLLVPKKQLSHHCLIY